MKYDTLISGGGEVKSLGGGKFGGHIVLFSTPKDPDLTLDYFTKSTDYDFEDGDSRSIYYQHGMDSQLKNAKLGRAELKMDDIGVWMEGQITLRNEYADAVVKLLEAGELGLSSGALSHLVRREAKKGLVSEVTHWPLGECSLTPTPAEPRTKASIKSLGDIGVVDADAGNCTKSVVSALCDRLSGALWYSLYEAEGKAETLADVDGIADEFKAELLRVCQALLEDTSEDAAKSLLASIGGNKVQTVRDLERVLRDAGLSKRNAAGVCAKGWNALNVREARETTNASSLRLRALAQRASLQLGV